jgi:hypothetical protein
MKPIQENEIMESYNSYERKQNKSLKNNYYYYEPKLAIVSDSKHDKPKPSPTPTGTPEYEVPEGF